MADAGKRQRLDSGGSAKSEVVWTTGYASTANQGQNVWVLREVVEEEPQTHSYAVIKVMWQHVCDGTQSGCDLKIIVDNANTGGDKVVIWCHRIFFELR